MEADLEWWATSSFMVGPVPVVVHEDATAGRVRDLAALEELRFMHDVDALFTLRFRDGSAVEVIVGRPGDDGEFTLTGAEAEAGLAEFSETDDVARTAAWLTEQRFVTARSARSGATGSRLFVRDDGWEVRYTCVLGAWTWELKPPGGAWVSFPEVRAETGEPCWHREIPHLIATP
ncbi:hypothetical protein [Catenuloplanes indicus]|uniref:Uncharacterized protein n=1 Tax=Catenuloplanes indicus TaxID=137267 RepID=A0AAE3W8M5_9ACTN|nr:hypothetical protein [Catenuloplanes indicus]MDQ0371501.1 hypothetical protein [Catenuloplanes indicus]